MFNHLITTSECEECRTVYYQNEECNLLEINLMHQRGEVSVQNYINSIYTMVETFYDVECEKCKALNLGNKHNRKVTKKLGVLPKLLVFQVVRSFENILGKEPDVDLTVDKVIDLSHAMMEEHENTKYKIKSVLRRGSSQHFDRGHYTSYICNQLNDRNWALCDDYFIHDESEAKALNPKKYWANL